MGLNYSQRNPKRGDKLWDERREGVSRNGTIISVNYEDKEVMVSFIGGGFEVYLWDDITPYYSSFSGGMYLLEDR